MTSPSIEIANLSKVFGSFTAVSNLSIKIEGSKCVGFLGPNGAGKTTTLKVLTDLIKPTSGQAFINGHNVHTQKKAALASVGTLIETPEMYPSLTPREALMMIAETRGVPRSERTHRIEESLAEVRMGEWIDKRVGKFSKGMKQRVCVAAAILSDPIIVILDEPTIGLDPRGMSEVRDIVKSLKKKNRLIFMSSHILSEVADVCDEVAMIDHGKLLVYDTLPNVTAKFSGGTNLVEAAFARPIEPQVLSTTLPGIGGVTKVERIDDRTVRIQFAGGLVAQQSILTDLVRANLGLLSYKPAASALEEVYLNLIADSR